MVVEIEPNQKISSAADPPHEEVKPHLYQSDMAMNVPTKYFHLQFRSALSSRHIQMSIAVLVVEI
jgi:hypothetical protein